LPDKKLVSQVTASELMQAPPPPMHGPKYLFSDEPPSVEPPPELRQHLKSFPPGHFPPTLTPLH